MSLSSPVWHPSGHKLGVALQRRHDLQNVAVSSVSLVFIFVRVDLASASSSSNRVQLQRLRRRPSPPRSSSASSARPRSPVLRCVAMRDTHQRPSPDRASFLCELSLGPSPAAAFRRRRPQLHARFLCLQGCRPRHPEHRHILPLVSVLKDSVRVLLGASARPTSSSSWRTASAACLLHPLRQHLFSLSTSIRSGHDPATSSCCARASTRVRSTSPKSFG